MKRLARELRSRAFWLMKSEPAVFSIQDLECLPRKTTGWDGVRNYEARNLMRRMRVGDQALFYHSNAQPAGPAGIVEIVGLATPDPTQFDKKDVHYDPKATPESPRWFQVDVRLVRAFARVVALEELRAVPGLRGMALFRRSRLSVQPVTEQEWEAILGLAEGVGAA